MSAKAPPHVKITSYFPFSHSKTVTCGRAGSGVAAFPGNNTLCANSRAFLVITPGIKTPLKKAPTLCRNHTRVQSVKHMGKGRSPQDRDDQVHQRNR